jgi:hypothetical protein
MATNGEQLNVSELDFAQIKANLIDYFKNSETEFTDWDFEGSNLNNIVDLLAYNTHYNAMLAHVAVNESFIDSAQLRSSVVSAAKLLGYVPRSFSAARVDIVGTIGATADSASTYVVPRGTRLTTNYDTDTYSFVVLDDVTTLQKTTDGELHYYEVTEEEPLIGYEGSLVTTTFEANAVDTGQRYELGDENIDISTLRVLVYPTAAKSEGSATRYNQFGEIDIDSESKIYFINENSSGRYELTFGNGIYGNRLDAGNVIEAQYLVTKGAGGNGINTAFSIVGDTSENFTQAGTSLSILCDARSSGGNDKETVERLKSNAINSFATQNRAVTADDYKNLITSKFSFIQSVSTWGGEDNDPPVYGTAFISAKPNSSYTDEVISEADKVAILDFLESKKVLAITPQIVDPEFANIVIDVLVKYDPSISSLSASELQLAIKNNVAIPFAKTDINGFDTIFRHSLFQRKVDNFNRSVMNSLVRVFLSQKITIPANGSISDFTVKFGAPLQPDDGLTLIKVYGTPTLTLAGERLYIKDEPGNDQFTRTVYTCTKNSDGTEQRVSLIGNINLDTGVMQLSNLFADNTTELCFVANTRSNDIVGKRNLLLDIDFDNSTFGAFPDEIARGGGSRSVDYTTFNKDRGSSSSGTSSQSGGSGSSSTTSY